MAKPRIIFLGTPDFAVPALRALAARDDIELHLVVTQPDRPSGRGKKLAGPPVKDAALELGLPLLQTDSLRPSDVKEQIIATRPDLVVVAAFGMILGKWILELPTYGCVNLHASLLPKYRGASPISAAILAGDTMTGVTLMQMDRGLDTGDMLASIDIPIEANDTTESLTPKLAEVAAILLDHRLSDLLAGAITSFSQPSGATETRQLQKEDGRINWNDSAQQIERQVRAMWTWPRAWTALPNGDRMQIHQAQVREDNSLSAGELALHDQTVLVGTGKGALVLKRVQLPGGKPIDGNAILQRMQSFISQRIV